MEVEKRNDLHPLRVVECEFCGMRLCGCASMVLLLWGWQEGITLLVNRREMKMNVVVVGSLVERVGR